MRKLNYLNEPPMQFSWIIKLNSSKMIVIVGIAHSSIQTWYKSHIHGKKSARKKEFENYKPFSA